ncbi:MAG TPA: DUF423 domain-containing protein, partial [Candidatus Angelobacter sp.]|nr:DUF423 domain-containing protein [Candidatus Angelobacter sp.]
MGPWLVAAAASGLMAIAMGAFAAHGLRSVLDADALDWLDTGSRYQMWHALVLFGVALLLVRIQPGRHRRILQAVAWAFLIGIVLFAGSLYLLALTHIRAFAWITPFGGVTLMAGWFGLILLGILRWRA